MSFFFSKRFVSIASAIYIWFVGLNIGVIFSSGAFSANVIFNAKDYGVDLERFQAGILMTKIFSYVNILLLILAFVVAFYEIIAYRLSNTNKLTKNLLFFSALISIICIFIFSLYCSPYIIEQQKLGEIATHTNEFIVIHKLSEWLFHILFISLSLNLAYRIFKLRYI